MKPSFLRKRSKKSLFELKPYLDSINDLIEKPAFVDSDPVQFMHAFTEKKDMEIAGFLAALLAWGRRDIVISKVNDLLQRMNYSPYDFVIGYDQSQFSKLNGFKHRTFKPIDIHGLICALAVVYRTYDDLESFFSSCYQKGNKSGRPFFSIFQEEFFKLSIELQPRTLKHISNPEKGSTCKRLYMFLRWTIRKGSAVDMGIWSFMDPSELLIPFDVHVARQARRYGLITRKTDDWKTVNNLTETLRLLNPNDPARYDYALFGLGALNYELPNKFLLNRV
ncbi:MAG: TIGR02757 family protein [Balneolaceae bacterium]